MRLKIGAGWVGLGVLLLAVAFAGRGVVSAGWVNRGNLLLAPALVGVQSQLPSSAQIKAVSRAFEQARQLWPDSHPLAAGFLRVYALAGADPRGDSDFFASLDPRRHEMEGLWLTSQGQRFQSMNRLAQAAQILRLALVRAPCILTGHAALADLLVAGQLQDEALADYRELIERCPEWAAAAYLRIGRIHQKQGNWPQAREAFSQALVRAGTSRWGNSWEPVEAHLGLGEEFYRLGQMAEAQAEFETVIETAPLDSGWLRGSAHFRLGQIFQAEHQLAVAEKQAKLAIEARPNHAWSHFLLAQIYEQQGRTRDAVQSYERTLTLDPTIKEAADALGRLRR